MSSRAFFCVFLLLIHWTAVANGEVQTTFEELSLEELLQVPIQVSSGGEAADVFRTPSSVSVIDRDMLASHAFGSVSEALQVLAGVTVTRTYLKRGIPVIRGVLQDHYANKVLVLIDGVPAWHPGTGEGNLDRVAIQDVERIEVLKGPASVLYGTNAFSGAVNIVRRAPGVERTHGALRLGGNGAFQAGASASGTLDGTLWALSAWTADDPGYDQPFTDEAGVYGVLPEYSVGRNLNARVERGPLHASFNAFENHESFLGNNPAWANGAGFDHWMQGAQTSLGVDYKPLPLLDLSLDSDLDWQERNYARTATDRVRTQARGFRISHRGLASWRFRPGWHGELGLEHSRRVNELFRNYDVVTDTTQAHNRMQDRSVTDFSLFGQLGGTLGERWSLLAGSRFTDNELFGNNISSRGTAVYALSARQSLKLMLGQSYRAPSVFELYFRTPQNTVWGNEALDPETSTSLEAAWLAQRGPVFGQVLLYHMIVDGKIHRVKRLPDDLSDNSTTYANGETFTAQGLEVELKLQRPGRLGGFLNGSWILGDDGDREPGTEHYNYHYVPAVSGTLGLLQPLGDHRLGLLVHHEGPREGPLGSIPAQHWIDLNLNLNQRLGEVEISQRLALVNLLDTELVDAESVRRTTLNAIPRGLGRTLTWTLVLGR